MPKDGIPAITNPPLMPAAQAQYLQPGDRVIGVVINGEARAYPLMVLTRHEVVNERVGGIPVAVTYCPLCDSVALFDRRTELGEREFGVSGLLYNSNVLIYDRGGKSEGLWSQLMAGGVSGPGSGTPLRPLPVELTTWGDWTERYPQTKTLAASDAAGRALRDNPYRRYFASPDLMFPVQPVDKRLPLKEKVLGVWTASAARAYPLSALAQLREPLAQEIDGRKFTLVYNPKAQSVRVSDADEGLHWMYSFWFGWYAFHPDTELFMARDAARALRRPKTSSGANPDTRNGVKQRGANPFDDRRNLVADSYASASTTVPLKPAASSASNRACSSNSSDRAVTRACFLEKST